MEEVEIVALQAEIDEQRARVEELTAERDSLREELELIRTQNAELTEENANTKKLNYTLARQLDTRPKRGFDETLVDLFGKGSKKDGH